MSGDTCTCGKTFRMGEDYRDHMPCPGSALEQATARAEKAEAKCVDEYVRGIETGKAMRAGLAAEVARLRAALTKIRDTVPVERRGDEWRCRWCRKWTRPMTDEPKHDADCPHVVARDALEVKP